MTEPRTAAGQKLMLLLAQSQIAWPDEYTYIVISALTPMFAAIEAEARAAALDEARSAAFRCGEWFAPSERSAYLNPVLAAIDALREKG